jgi:hypothetical protein
MTSSNDDGKGKLVNLKQPKIKSSHAILEALRKLFHLVRSKKALSIVVVVVWENDTYINAVVPVDNYIIEDTMDLLMKAREKVASIGK